MNDPAGVETERSVLFVGDIHLGRRPPALDAVLDEVGIKPHDISAAAAWTAAVDVAIDRGVRAVVLAGDVIEGETDRFEAFGLLERETRRLVEAGIPVFAVAGNHDAIALPLLARRIPTVTLLGEGGRWECRPLPGPGTAIDLLGWSFPERIVRADPTAGRGFAEAIASCRTGALLIGVVHGDLDVSNSPYAPLDRHRLSASPAAAWLLGHIHRPDALGRPHPLGYLGSLGALDAGEPGVHGPWELTPAPDGPTLAQIPLSPVRFENLEVELDDASAADEDSVIDAIRRAVNTTFGAAIEKAAPRLKLFVVRAILTGRVSVRRGAAEASATRGGPTYFEIRGVPCTVTRIEDRTRPAIDLDTLARETSPAGEIARLIRALEDDAVPGDLERMAAGIIHAWSTGPWDLDGTGPLPDVRTLLLRAAWRALGILADQKHAGADH